MPVAPLAAAVAIRREPAPEPRPVASTSDAGANGSRKLHLSLGGSNGANGNGHAPMNGGATANGNGSANGDGHGYVAPRSNFMASRPLQPQGLGEPMPSRPIQAPPRNLPPFDAGRNGRDPLAFGEGRPPAQQPRDVEAVRKDNSAFIDQELRSRVDGDIAAFLTAFDAVLAADTQESRFGLREATDRLLRAGARTRIELERLEARVPLPPRDGGAAPDPAAWRHR